jgi:rhodanese-related sulfurtransferase
MPRLWLTLLLALLPQILLAAEFQTPAITAAELDAKRDTPEAYLIVDVREANEYRKGHIPGAINIPHTELGDHLDALEHPNSVVVYCIVGRRTRLAEQTLLDAGLSNVYHIEGGFGAWISGNLFIKKGKKP